MEDQLAYKKLHVKNVDFALHRGNVCAGVWFGKPCAGSEALTVKEVVQRINRLATPYVLLQGDDPVATQNMRMLVGICYLLKHRENKKIFVKTEATRFNQLLFFNTKHYILCPKKETYKADRFGRYVECSSYKIFDIKKAKIPDFTPTMKDRSKNYPKFVEIEFNVSCSDDLAFAVDVFNSRFGEDQLLISDCDIRTIIRPVLWEGYSVSDFAKDWIIHNECFKNYKYCYLME